ncbi:hypothetical protein [Streptomyces sp. NPDC001089]
MNVSAKFAALAARLTGKVGVHDSIEQLAAALDKQVDQVAEERVPEYLAGAARLGSPAAYQPGLFDLRCDAYDMAVYLDALTTAATALGDADLVEALVEAGEVAHELVARLAVATHATIPAPVIPVGHAA